MQASAPHFRTSRLMVWLRMLERRAAIHLARHTLILTLSPPEYQNKILNFMLFFSVNFSSPPVSLPTRKLIFLSNRPPIRESASC